MAKALNRRLSGPIGGALAVILFLFLTSFGAQSSTDVRDDSIHSLLQLGDRAGLTTRLGGHLWDEILVINLPHRKDRREHMEKLSAALSLPFTFIPAISTSHSIVPWIRERLLDDQIEADATPGGIRTFVPSANWNGTGAPWRAQALRVLEDESITYEVQRTEDELSALHYPPVYRGAGEMWPRGPTACWLSHLKAMKHAIDSGVQSVLILEDDVDIEFSVVAKWEEMSRALNKRENGWDAVYVGFICADERTHLPTFHPGLRRSYRPLGTHAYSLSHRGMRRLYKLLTEEPTVFQRPIDHEIPFMIIATLREADERSEPHPFEFEVYSAVPPLIIPGGADAGLGTDIGGDGGTGWDGLLGDSTLRRIAAYEGRPLPQTPEAVVLAMPAVGNL